MRVHTYLYSESESNVLLAAHLPFRSLHLKHVPECSLSRLNNPCNVIVLLYNCARDYGPKSNVNATYLGSFLCVETKNF